MGVGYGNGDVQRQKWVTGRWILLATSFMEITKAHVKLGMSPWSRCQQSKRTVWTYLGSGTQVFHKHCWSIFPMVTSLARCTSKFKPIALYSWVSHSAACYALINSSFVEIFFIVPVSTAFNKIVWYHYILAEQPKYSRNVKTIRSSNKILHKIFTG
jgi:hypothetical protein